MTSTSDVEGSIISVLEQLQDAHTSSSSSSSQQNQAVDVMRLFGEMLKESGLSDDKLVAIGEIAFPLLLKYAEDESLQCRRISQAVFSQLLDCLDVDTQCLTLGNLFERIATKQIPVKMGPQLLALIIDTHRKRMRSGGRPYQRQTQHLYGQINDLDQLEYSNLLYTHHFHVSVYLMISEHAALSFNKELLRKGALPFLERSRSNLAEFLHMLKKRRELNRTTTPMEAETEEMEFQLELMKFSLLEVEQKVKEALK